MKICIKYPCTYNDIMDREIKDYLDIKKHEFTCIANTLEINDASIKNDIINYNNKILIRLTTNFGKKQYIEERVVKR